MDEGALSGRVCLVTGANSGIGFEVALGLARQQATVVLACRSAERGQAAVAALRASSGHDRIELAQVDLSLQSSVRELARSVRARFARLDVLVNNAAVWPSRRELTAEGIELTWATNVLAPFLLTSLLLDLLCAARPARVLNVGSIAAGALDLADLDFARRRFLPMRAYAQSKQALHMLSWASAERLDASGVTVHVVHPGAVGTALFQRRPGALGAFLDWGLNLVGRSAERGADTNVWLAIATRLPWPSCGACARPCAASRRPTRGSAEAQRRQTPRDVENRHQARGERQHEQHHPEPGPGAAGLRRGRGGGHVGRLVLGAHLHALGLEEHCRAIEKVLVGERIEHDPSTGEAPGEEELHARQGAKLRLVRGAVDPAHRQHRVVRALGLQRDVLQGLLASAGALAGRLDQPRGEARDPVLCEVLVEAGGEPEPPHRQHGSLRLRLRHGSMFPVLGEKGQFSGS
jgi:NAD(P)-dependent dehydrogenase (short-subunit alcohol dehydrogenase family)